jgi:predicted MFS family arabinose efflux permease
MAAAGPASGLRLALSGGPLAQRNFRLLVGGNVISMVGTAMAGVAVPFAVLASGGSVGDIGYVAAAGLVPTIAFLLYGGVLADRLPRQQVMVTANICQGLAQAGFAVLVLTGTAQLWEMMLLSAARGCAFGFYMPAAQGLLPQTVQADQLASANAVQRLGLNGAQIGGSALGGVVVAAAGPGWGLVVDAASYGIAALLRAGMHFDKLPPMARSGVVHELREGWHAFVSRRWLWPIVVQFGLVNATFYGAFNVLGPALAKADLGGAGSWGLVLAAESVGAVLGAALMLRYRPRRLLYSASLAVPLVALPLLALVGPSAVAVIAATALVAGAGVEVFSVNWSTALQEQIPPNLLSRVAAYDALGSFALTPIGTALAGPIALTLGTTATLAGAATLIIVSAAAVLSVTEVRVLTRRTSAAPAPTR